MNFDRENTVYYINGAGSDSSVVFIPVTSSISSSLQYVIPQNNVNAAVGSIQTHKKSANKQQKQAKNTKNTVGKKSVLQNTAAAPSARWRPILPKILPKLAPSVVRGHPHSKMDYCDCEFCNNVQPPSTTWRAASSGADDLPRPRAIRPATPAGMGAATSGGLSAIPPVFQPVVGANGFSPLTLSTSNATPALIGDGNNSLPYYFTDNSSLKTAYFARANLMYSVVSSSIPPTKATVLLPTTSNSTIVDNLNKDSQENNNKYDNYNDNKNSIESVENKFKWYNSDAENEAKRFRDYLKLTACKFKRSVEPTFEQKQQRQTEAAKTTKSEKRQRTRATKKKAVVAQKNSSNATPAAVSSTTLFNASSLGSMMTNLCGSDRFSPSSVSCASIDSGFSDSYTPESPESTPTAASISATSFGSLQQSPSSDQLRPPAKRKQLNEYNNNDNNVHQEQIFTNNKRPCKIERELDCRATTAALTTSNGLLMLKTPNDFDNDKNDKENNNNIISRDEEKPVANVPKIAEIFFNSTTSNFVNTLLKRSRQNSENLSGEADETVWQLNGTSNISACVEFVASKTLTAATSADVPLPDHETTTATLRSATPKKPTTIAGEKIARLYLQPEKQTSSIPSNNVISADIDTVTSNSSLTPHLSSAKTSFDSVALSTDDEELTASSSDISRDNALLECGCQWRGCASRFKTDNQLYDHVFQFHLEKLRPTQKEQSRVSPRQKTKLQANVGGRKATDTFLVCKWDNCKMCLKRGDHQKQFEWLIEHYTTRHAPRAQPFACLFESCELRFRTRRSLNDHLRVAHDSEKPNGKRGSNVHGNSVCETVNHSYGYAPRVQIALQSDIMDRRTMDWIRGQLQFDEEAAVWRQPHASNVAEGRAARRKVRFSSTKFASELGDRFQPTDENIAYTKCQQMAKDEVTKLLSGLFHCGRPKVRAAA